VAVAVAVVVALAVAVATWQCVGWMSWVIASILIGGKLGIGACGTVAGGRWQWQWHYQWQWQRGSVLFG
jgi:hypothetical protein